MFSRLFLSITLIFTLLACAEGTLHVDQVDPPDNEEEPQTDTGITSDTGTTFDTGGEDTGTECCSPTDDVQCSDSDTYIECVDDGDGCAQWSDPVSCPTDHLCNDDVVSGDPCEPEILCDEDHPDFGQACTAGLGICENSGTNICSSDGTAIECGATPGDPEPKQCNGEDSNCDGTVDSEGVCGPCIDDDFAPENFVIQNAAPLNVGDTHADLVLCDNQNAGASSHNWFSLGQTSSIDITLQWEEVQGTLGMDLWTSTGAPTDRVYHASAGSDSNQLTHQETLSSTVHVFARVFFWPDTTKPPAGTPYTLSRD